MPFVREGAPGDVAGITTVGPAGSESATFSRLEDGRGVLRFAREDRGSLLELRAELPEAELRALAATIR
jgi:hypothetical protein